MDDEVRTFQAYSGDGKTLECMKCERSLHTKDVAMFIRTSPKDAFSAWCPECTRFVIMHAAQSLELDEIASIVIAF